MQRNRQAEPLLEYSRDRVIPHTFDARVGNHFSSPYIDLTWGAYTETKNRVSRQSKRCDGLFNEARNKIDYFGSILGTSQRQHFRVDRVTLKVEDPKGEALNPELYPDGIQRIFLCYIGLRSAPLFVLMGAILSPTPLLIDRLYIARLLEMREDTKNRRSLKARCLNHLRLGETALLRSMDEAEDYFFVSLAHICSAKGAYSWSHGVTLSITYAREPGKMIYIGDPEYKRAAISNRFEKKEIHYDGSLAFDHGKRRDNQCYKWATILAFFEVITKTKEEEYLLLIGYYL